MLDGPPEEGPVDGRRIGYSGVPYDFTLVFASIFDRKGSEFPKAVRVSKSTRWPAEEAVMGGRWKVVGTEVGCL